MTHKSTFSQILSLSVVKEKEKAMIMVSGFAGGLGLSGNDCEMQSGKICGMRFNTLEQHTEYLKKGGCQQLINVLASTMN